MNMTRITRNVSTAAVATIAAWSSWSHMVHVALRFGERPEVAYVLPLSVDGMLIVASTAMVEDRRQGRAVRWSARVAFAAGVAASVAANIAAAHPSAGARIVAAWPAIALLLVVEILSRARRPDTAHQADAGLADADRPDTHLTPPAESGALLGEAAHLAPGQRQQGLPAQGSARVRPGVTRTAEVVARIRAERPNATFADIAAEARVSERHVRRLLRSDSS
ncbi:hypothetical protein GCM10022251_79860 [Phytohabitans flavus]|uniref:DUF2637 domain-containing protein n=1 Tax=Phytohabitans flavus TaxID=1076124 RepID=A0A6F8Y4C7_9ACTN|nr:DUF2637 domain-containing protein [Phytohabitans flavus]BCB80883.1 hypothetical protein Pflav_072930 [Phytohabitans flavus]